MRKLIVTIILRYRRGSFGQWETHRSVSDALERSAILLKGEGCSNLQLEEDGKVVMTQADIIAKVAKTKKNNQAAERGEPN